MFLYRSEQTKEQHVNLSHEANKTNESYGTNEIFETIKAIETNETQQMNTKAKILKVYTDIPLDYGWYVVPQDVREVTIYAEVEHVDTVLFWLIPTGTETWSERKLIGYDQDGSDGFSLTWEFGDQILLNRISIQALGSDFSTMDYASINIVISH